MKYAAIATLFGAVTLAAATMSLAQTPPQTSATIAAPGAGRGGAPRAEWPPGYVEPGLPQPPYMPANTPLGTGPYKAIMATEAGAEEFVAYYPADLAALGNKKLPILIWGNGSCSYVGNKFRHFLTEIASHGYFALAGGPMSAPDEGRSETITISSNNPLQDPEAVPSPPAARTGTPRQAVTVELLSKGIDWTIAENNRQGSKFYLKLDTSKVSVMGQSCGGGLAAHFGADKRVKTIGVWSGQTEQIAEYRNTLRVPALLVTGDPRYDIAFYWGLKDFDGMRKTKAPVFYAWRNNLTHLGTYRQTDGGELAPIALAWLDWRLKGNKAAAAMFIGPDCDLCTNAHWHVQKKNMN